MKVLLPLTTLSVLLLLFQNCQEHEALSVSENDDGSLEITEVVSELNRFESIQSFNYFSDTELSWSAQTEKITLRQTLSDETVTLRSCATPNDLLLELRSLWDNARVCRTSYRLPPDTASCMAIAEPYALLINSEEYLELKGTICHDDKIDLCDEPEYSRLNLILDVLLSLKDSLECEPIS